MGTSQQFSLRWNNYLRHIREAFDSLRTDEDLVDVTLSCEGKKIRAHKMLLSACSTYFRDLFKENPCQHPVIIFKDVKFADLKALIDFIYQGEVNVVQDQLSSFLLTAELLAVQGLTDGSSKDVPEISSETNTAKLLDLSAHDEESRTPERSGSPSDSLHSPPVKKQRCNDANASPTSTSVSDTHSASACASEKLSEQCAPSLSNSCPEICKQTRTEAIRPADMIKVEMPDYLDHDSVELCASSENGEERVENPANSSSDRKGPPYLPHLNSHDISHHSINPLLDISRVMGLCGPSSALCSRELTQDFVCPECGAVFKNLQGLNVHKSRHNGGTACELCFRDFGSKSNLRKHFFEVHSWCLLCSVNFSTKACLRKHIDKEHGNIQQYLKSFNQSNFLWH